MCFVIQFSLSTAAKLKRYNILRNYPPISCYQFSIDELLSSVRVPFKFFFAAHIDFNSILVHLILRFDMLSLHVQNVNLK